MTENVLHFKDRSGVLTFFGILLILSGIGSFLLILFIALGSLIGQFSPESQTMGNLQVIVFSILVYTAIGIMFIVLGVGSIMKKRWARIFILILHWTWLASGIFTLVFFILLFPHMMDQMRSTVQNPEILPTVLMLLILLLSVILIIHPLVFIIIYQNKNVKLTMMHRDPNPSWAERCPMPVLALSFLQIYAALTVLGMGMYGWVFPFFGTFLTGTGGALAVLILSGFYVYTAIEIYNLQLHAWWMLMGLMLLLSVSAVITFSRYDVLDMYRLMHFPEEQIAMMQNMAGFWNHDFPIYMLFSLLVYAGCLLVVKQYFYRDETKN